MSELRPTITQIPRAVTPCHLGAVVDDRYVYVYVYVISNIGAFGPGIVTIGMTRRLEPMDRVKELGDAEDVKADETGSFRRSV